MNWHQAFERFQEDVLVAHDQVATLDQRQAQVARQIGVFKIGFVVRARRQQRQMRVRAGRTGALEAIHQGTVGGGQALHLQRLKGQRKLGRNREPVFQQIAKSRWRLATLPLNPPVAVGSARQIKGRNVQAGAADRLDAPHGTQVTRVAVHQRSRQQAALQQLLRAVNIGHDALEQAHPLQDAGFDLLPALRLDQQGKQVERPGTLRTAFIGINVVGHAVVANLAPQRAAALVQIRSALSRHCLKKLLPEHCQGAFCGTGLACRRAQFVKMPVGGDTGARQRLQTGQGAGVVSRG